MPLGPAPGVDVAPPVDATPSTEPAASKSPGCVSGQGLPEGDGTIMVGGMNRQYRVRLPKNYSKDRACPLVLALHPNGGAGIGFFDGGERPVRKLLEEKAVLIVPLARPKGSGWPGFATGAAVEFFSKF
jgi:polyhydroxybutyrate depolymerase